MRKLIFFLLVICPCFLQAQIGLKAGLNFADVTGTSSINNSSQTGFHAGFFLAPGGNKKILGFRTELLYSKQGYNYQTEQYSGKVDLDYITSANFLAINITHYFQLQLGTQMAYLINAKVDSNKTGLGSSAGSYGKLLDYYNRFDFGFAGGFEVHPISGLLIGARLNISITNLYKTTDNGVQFSASASNLKNNLFQVYTGWQFGLKSSKKKK